VVVLAAGVVVLLLTASTFAYGAHLENNDRFCASCHTEPESTYVARARQSAVDLASAHKSKGVGCIDCHSGNGPGGRLDALKLGARDLDVYLRGNYPQPSVLTHPIPDANCLKCHQDVLQNRTFDNHFHLFLPRWQAVAPGTAATCVSCHTSHATDGESRLGWLNKSRTVAQCNACHRTAGED
jgi:nitrate/TMAO reductase-like tetraheme cytochrome c subunit